MSARCGQACGSCAGSVTFFFFLRELLCCSEWFSVFLVLPTVAVKFFGHAKSEKGAGGTYK